MFPYLDIILASKPFALIITPEGTFEFVPITKRIGHYFWIKQYGIFHIVPEKFKLVKNGGGRARIALYDARSGNPLDWDVLKILENYSKKHKFLRLTKQNINPVIGDVRKMTGDQIVETVAKGGTLVPHEPLDANAKLWLDEFKNYKPKELGTYLTEALQLKKNHNLLKNTPIKPTLQIGLIMGIVVIGLVIAFGAKAFIGDTGGGNPLEGLQKLLFPYG